ncbi:hypothetical protein L7F22_062571 [Adiantum nelumboides]|nr:hypothetical protein [Adiantum nelumboides]
MPSGRLKMKGLVVQARIVPTLGRCILSHKHDPVICYFCRNYRGLPYSSLALPQIRQCQLEVGTNLKLPLDVHFFFVHPSSLSRRTQDKINASGRQLQALVEPRDHWYESVRQEEVDDSLDMVNRYGCAFTLNLPNEMCAHSLPPLDVWLVHMGRFKTGFLALTPTQATIAALLICIGNVGADENSELQKLGTLTLSDNLWDADFSDVDHLIEYTLGGFGKDSIQMLWTALAKPPQSCYSCFTKTPKNNLLDQPKKQVARI